MSDQPLSRNQPPLADIVASDKFRDTLRARADAHTVGGNYPLWHGWAIMDAFLAGAEYARSETGTTEVGGVPIRTITIPLRTALMVRKVCLPHNPNKCRGWDPEALQAVRTYIAAVEGANRQGVAK